MPEEIQIDAPRLYRDLQDHFGTANETIPWICSTHWLSAALGELDTLASNGDWNGVVELAKNEGFNIDDYVI